MIILLTILALCAIWLLIGVIYFVPTFFEEDRDPKWYDQVLLAPILLIARIIDLFDVRR